MTQDPDRPGFQWLDARTVRTTYDMLLYGFDDCQAEPPLSPGCLVRVGPYRYRVLAEEPETATVLLVMDVRDALRRMINVLWNRIVKR